MAWDTNYNTGSGPAPTQMSTKPIGSTTNYNAASSPAVPPPGYGTTGGHATPWKMGGVGQGMEQATNYIGDLAASQAQNTNWGLQAQQSSYNQLQSSINDWIKRFNAQMPQLQGMNNALTAGWNQQNAYMQPLLDFMPTLDKAYQSILGAGNQYQNAYNQQGQAYQNVLQGIVPQATQDMINDRFNTELAQTQRVLQDEYARQNTNLLDNLGARGILNSTTSQGAVTGLGSSTQKAMQDAAQTYGIQRLNTLLEEPYKQYTAANTLGNQAAQFLAGQQGSMQSALGQYGALNQNYQNASQSFQNLMNSIGMQANLGQMPMNELQNLASMQGGLASIGGNVYNQAWQPIQNIWGNLLNAETQRMTSQNALNAAQAQSGGNNNIWGAIGSLLGGIF